MCVKHSALVIRLKGESVRRPVLPYKKPLCLCGVSGDCIEVYDGFVHHVALVHTEVYRGNVGIISCCVEVACLPILKCSDRFLCHNGRIMFFNNGFICFYFGFPSDSI